ncbi:MAG: glycosyltransferase [Gaiella sp.]|nr:glycosyltransferase [Gaiella sp.]
MARDPAVSVLVAVHDGARYLRPALASILRQTVSDLELVVVDDGSTDETPDVLASVGDPRLRVVRSERRRGLAGALNLGLDEVRGRRVARMDADDVAFPHWLARVLARLDGTPRVVLVGAGVLELRTSGGFGAVHVPEAGPAVTRWHSLFSSSPFFHNTVVFERDHFARNGLRYDESFGESEDYELWTRVLAGAEADVVEEPLVAYRVHAAQASQRRAELQHELGRRVALGQIRGTAPNLSEADRALAWRFGFLQALAMDELERGAEAYLELLRAFTGAGRYGRDELEPVRRIAARTVARRAGPATGAVRARLVRRALALDPALPLRVSERRAGRARARRRATAIARATLRASATGAVRAVLVLPEPTPYRTGMLDRLAERPELELTVVYAARAVQQRVWDVELGHRAVVVDGKRVPGAARVLRHDYPLSLGIFGALRDARPEVVVVSGWSTFASQATIAWCRRRGVPLRRARRVERARLPAGLAESRQGCGRPVGGRWRGRDPRRRHARAPGNARERDRPGAGVRRREHRRRRAIRTAGGRARGAARRPAHRGRPRGGRRRGALRRPPCPREGARHARTRRRGNG